MNGIVRGIIGKDNCSQPYTPSVTEDSSEFQIIFLINIHICAQSCTWKSLRITRNFNVSFQLLGNSRSTLFLSKTLNMSGLPKSRSVSSAETSG